MIGYLDSKIYSIEPNKLIFADITIHPTYEVNIELKLEKNTRNAWCSILNFIVPNNSLIEYGAPAVFLHGCSNRMNVVATLDQLDRCFGKKTWQTVWNSNEMHLHTWFKLKIKQSRSEQSEYIFEVFIDDKLRYRAENKRPMILRNVNGYIGYVENESKWGRHHAPGQYRNFDFFTPSN